MRKRMMQLAGRAKVDYMKNFSDYMSKKMGIKTVPTATPVQDTPAMSQEEIDKALLDIQNMPVNDTQYFQTGFERDATGQNQAIPYDANAAIYEEAEKAEKPKNNPFLLLRGLSTAASFLSNTVARRAQDKYDFMQQTALGQMNPMPVNQFQPTYNNMYGEKGGNPFSTYAKYGGNLKNIMKDYEKFSNEAQMDMGDGKVDDKGLMRKGGMNIPEMYTQDMVRKLLYIGRFAHPYRGKKMGGKLEKDECNHCMETEIKLEKGGFSMKASKWKKGGSLTPNKARMILHDGTAHGKPLTDKQRRYFGAMSKGHTNFRGK